MGALSRKMRVLIISTNSDMAGAPNHVITLVKHLISRVNFIVIFGAKGPISAMMQALGVTVEIIPQLRSTLSPRADLIALSSIIKVIRIYKPDLMHAHSSKAGMLGRVATLLTGVPCIYTVHGWGWRGFGIFTRRIILFIEKILSFIPKSLLIYVSHSVELEAKYNLSLPKCKGIVIHNGVDDIKGKSIKFEKIQIFMPARVALAKDHETLIKAFEQLAFPCDLLLCGSGTDSKEFKKQALMWAPKRYKDISFLGPRSDIQELLTKVDIFVLISNFEALPISIIEAMSAGKAIVATNVGGVMELIDDGLNGISVSKGDIDSVVHALNKFTNLLERIKFGEEARRKYLLKFTSEEMANKIFLLYCNMLKEN